MIYFIYISYILLSFYMVAIIHESIHYIFAFIFKREELSFKISPVQCYVSYKNNDNDFQNLIISSSAPLLTTFIGLIILIFFTDIKGIGLIFFTNLLNFTPLTSDGEVILVSILNILRRKK